MWESAALSILTVLPQEENRHSIHAYFNTCPESPDGKYVLYFSSTAPDGQSGELRILERATGKESVLTGELTTEDAHRAACQQWTDHGRKVAYHDCVNGRWQVWTVDIATGQKQLLAEDRQLGFGAARSCEIPLYGCHWNPGEHRHLEMADVNTGAIRKAVEIECVLARYGDWIEETLGGRNVSVFFPVVSPDARRVFFKIALGRGGDDFHSWDASKREGKVVFDLQENKFLCLLKEWGHPSWTPDGNGILEKGNSVYRLDSGETSWYAVQPEGCLRSPSDHPSVSPDGAYFVSDANFSWRENGKPGEVGVIVARTSPAPEFRVIERFVNDRGAQSWRKPHPHPVFSPDGKRIYYNSNKDGWTRLVVVEQQA